MSKLDKLLPVKNPREIWVGEDSEGTLWLLREPKRISKRYFKADAVAYNFFTDRIQQDYPDWDKLFNASKVHKYRISTEVIQ